MLQINENTSVLVENDEIVFLAEQAEQHVLFIEEIIIPLIDWKQVKNYIDKQINSKATDSHE
jgi:hypothetical protein